MSAAAGEVTPRPFPWEAAIHAGFCLLRLSSETFWRLTPREFFAMTGGNAVPRGPDRQAMEAMMRRFPDG
ncbi:phage tail assembly chaperone [Agrobacterium tumefaciens]|uniref:rcc01693 family protein n=1 Tax=Agrobacterium tumefaciens TaxID=358 RepID=UPI00080F761C|nr:rcc01693 family protein [Agrobacterium tumefaciens]MBS0258979.1 phage tail assembly chaperone [Pseudomonadota bacterium]NSY95005.1 phage tail assembly chaperone [Agrobacterium tumefaciens]NSZ01806.1 phage tail assembly chaperone [Agrobacterium tumefaciens]NSZ38807.1 phage tail assembly chaperone [Agrobacterium tumefaciens]NTB01522.1 phage tail assembly chaperone [Agrobacterium tumefaciens]